MAKEIKSLNGYALKDETARQTLEQEIANREQAMENEANARQMAINNESSARRTAIQQAVNDEATARELAIQNEAKSRETAIQRETELRTQAIELAKEEINNLIGGACIKYKLWENASPSSNFPAQTLDISWEDYDFILIHFRHYTTANYCTTNIIAINDTFNTAFLNSALPHMNSYLYLYGRTLNFEDGGIMFHEGYSHDTNSATEKQGNEYAVPLVIYGIKGVE